MFFQIMFTNDYIVVQELKLLSPMQRFAGAKKYAEDDDLKYIPYKAEDVNHF